MENNLDELKADLKALRLMVTAIDSTTNDRLNTLEARMYAIKTAVDGMFKKQAYTMEAVAELAGMMQRHVGETNKVLRALIDDMN